MVGGRARQRKPVGRNWRHTVAGGDPDSPEQGKSASVWPAQASNFRSKTERIGLTSLGMPGAAKFCAEFNPALHQRKGYFCTRRNCTSERLSDLPGRLQPGSRSWVSPFLLPSYFF